MTPLDADATVGPLIEGLRLFARLALPVALGLAIAAGVDGLARRARVDGGAGRLLTRWLAVLGALLIAGPLMAEALFDFARWAWAGP